MKTKHIFIAFIALAIAQLFISSKMIFDNQKIVDEGVVFKFKTVPIDPYDAFRGKYITLNYEIESYKTNDQKLERDDNVFITISNDSLGFAKIDSILLDKPDYLSPNYFEATVSINYNGIVRLNFPFDRYYMEETKAQKAEDTLRVLSRENERSAYATISILNGTGIVTDVLVENQSIKDYVE